MTLRLRRPPLYGPWIRVRRALGWPGLAGLLLLAAAGAQQLRMREAAASDVVVVAQAVAPRRAVSAAAPPLAMLDERALPALQRALAARAAIAGLGWPAADYRLLPATDSLPPAYEVHCSLKGGYPAIRRFVAETLAGAPSAALREFALARGNADTGDVEAHLGFAFFLRPQTDDAAASGAQP